MTAQKKSSPVIRGVVTIALLITAGLLWVLYHTTYFTNARPAPAGYLDISEYRLVSADGSLSSDPLRTFDFDEFQSYWTDEVRTTTKGITVGSTWEDFLAAYGNYTARYIDVYSEHADYDNESYYGTHHVSYITPAEYDSRYIQTGIIDPNTEEISVCFEVYARGTDLLYTEAEIEDAINRYYDKYFRIGPARFSLSPQYKMISFTFSFDPADQLYEHEGEEGSLLHSMNIYKY